jgi:hypothetical protein
MSTLQYFDYPGFGEQNKAALNYSQSVRIDNRIEVSGQGTSQSPRNPKEYRTNTAQAAGTDKLENSPKTLQKKSTRPSTTSNTQSSMQVELAGTKSTRREFLLRFHWTISQSTWEET